MLQSDRNGQIHIIYIKSSANRLIKKDNLRALAVSGGAPSRRVAKKKPQVVYSRVKNWRDKIN